MIDPQNYAVSRVGPYAGILGPYAVDGMSRYVVNKVTGLWGMQVAELKSGRIVTASLTEHPASQPELLHGIGWTPDEREVWQSSRADDPHIYVWSMRDPMAPVLSERVSMKSRHGAHWVTFDIEGDYAYVAPNKSSDDATEIFDAHTHKSVGLTAEVHNAIAYLRDTATAYREEAKNTFKRIEDCAMFTEDVRKTCETVKRRMMEGSGTA